MTKEMYLSAILLGVFCCHTAMAGAVNLTANGVNWGTNYYNPDERTGDQYDGLPMDAEPDWEVRRSSGGALSLVGNALRVTTDVRSKLEFAQNSNFDLRKDSTIELTVRVVEQRHSSGAGIITFGQPPGGERSFLWLDKYGLRSNGKVFGMANLKEWTTIRITFQNISDSNGEKKIKVYINNNPAPIIETLSWYPASATTCGIGFGDVSSTTVDGVVDYESIRWTSDGAFPPRG